VGAIAVLAAGCGDDDRPPSRVDRRTGRIRDARMDNRLDLRMRVGCDETLERCQAEFPLRLQRQLHLRLRDGAAPPT
jgi:hypothetical protein